MARNVNVDHYQQLGISYNVSLSDIGRAYRLAALKYHPDKQSSQEQKKKYTPFFLAIQEAYETLSDPDTRDEYEREYLPELHESNTREEGIRKLAAKHAKEQEAQDKAGCRLHVAATHRAGVIEPTPVDIYVPYASFKVNGALLVGLFASIEETWEQDEVLLNQPPGNEAGRLRVLQACDSIQEQLDLFQTHVKALRHEATEFARAVVREIERSKTGRAWQHEAMVDDLKATWNNIEIWERMLWVWNKTAAGIVRSSSIVSQSRFARSGSRKLGAVTGKSKKLWLDDAEENVYLDAEE